MNDFQTQFINSIHTNLSKKYPLSAKQIKVINQLKVEAGQQLKQLLQNSSTHIDYTATIEAAVTLEPLEHHSITEKDIKPGPTINEEFMNSKNLGDKMEEYIRILDLVRNNSDLLKSRPGFIDRIKECEEDIQNYETTGQIPTRNIQMMKHALHID